MQPADIVGWTASVVLFATISRQVWKQWKEGQREGVSRWLFIGQMTASALFVVYSWMVGNWVFVATNTFMLLAAITGQIATMRAARREAAD
jgi:MtN3 and saliva related transmembrane protein